MNLNNVPSKVEVMGWNPQTLSNYMKRLKLTGCDKVVMKGGISGAQFLRMNEYDLQVFPSHHFLTITMIQSEVCKGEKKRSHGNRSNAQKYPTQALTQEQQNWDSDEFDNDSDENYEEVDPEESEKNYISAETETQSAEEEDNEECYECFDEPVHDPPPVERTSKPPNRALPRVKPSPPEPFRPPPSHSASQPSTHIDRSKKPGQSGQGQFPKLKGSAVKALGSFSSKFRPPKAPKPTELSKIPTKLPPVHPAPTQPPKVGSSKPKPRKDFDCSWYGGQVTRQQAEDALRDMNKDGAFMVRDSSKGFAEHPYTLMLLKEDKVYNIQIRNQGNSYSLGTGLKNTESFPGVEEMITHYKFNPLVLIDGTDRDSETQNQSCLLHPAGL